MSIIKRIIGFSMVLALMVSVLPISATAQYSADTPPEGQPVQEQALIIGDAAPVVTFVAGTDGVLTRDMVASQLSLAGIQDDTPFAANIEYGVSAIGDNAFDKHDEGQTGITIPGSMTSVTIPGSVTALGYCAFAYCGELTNVIIPDSVEIIGERAFDGCINLISVKLSERVTSLGWGVFASCPNLESITFPDSITSIGQSTFSGCHGLKSITFSDNLESIGPFAFDYCYSLESITFPESLKSIDAMAFFRCLVVKNITIPDSVTYIGWSAFAGGESLTRVDIPNSVTDFGPDVFLGCPDIVVYCFPGSYAEAYAIENDLKYAYFDSEVPTLQSISITAPAKTEYFAGEELDLSGLVVTANYNFGGDKFVTDYTTDPANGTVLSLTDNKVTVSYQGFSASFDIIVKAPAVTGIAITSEPGKTEYFVGQTLDLSGLVVTASYDFGGDEEVNGYTTDPENETVLSTVGTITVNVSYEGIAAEFDITVNEFPPLTVSVSTPSIVETLSAYLNITVSGEGLSGKEAMAWVIVGEKLLYETPVVDGVARMFVPVAPAAGDYELVVRTSDGLAYGSCFIEVIAYNTDIWVLNSSVNEEGFVTLVFNETIAAKDGKFDREVSLNGKVIGCALGADGKTLITNVKYADLASGDNTFTATGVKYPRLFPSYSFTFETVVAK